ncbi:HNH endonuclease [Nocardioides panacisoli]|uniref:HNH endonuclease n=1 Tax=Nocardioides panacisoli TaxID=627624 RepID=UPI001C638923|nr:HNH endonuclease [Nocardioides panacisoli]QYJ04221.1 HNH endonuclease [Nocardioides panacisoli]
MTWLEDISDALRTLGGSATLAQIYDEAAQRRGVQRTNVTEATVRRMIQDHSSDSQGFKHGTDLFFSVQGLGAGVWGLRDQVEETPAAADLDGGAVQPQRAAQLTYRILRDTRLARQVKLLHRDRCQICGEALRLGDGRTYSEGHHIIPLGGAHNGPDTAENIIVLCPNHHALCDYGAIRLDFAALRQVPGHQISQGSIDYHNREIFGHRFPPVRA